MNIEILKKLKRPIFKKTLSLSIVYGNWGHNIKKYLKKKNQLKY